MRKLKDRPTAIIFKDNSRAEQAHANDVDINQIMAKAQQGIPSDYIRENAGHYMDATSLSFYQSQTIIANANSMFEDLPAKIRNRFENDPGKFLSFVQDEKNLDEMVELKLIDAPIIDDPEPTPEPKKEPTPGDDKPE